MLRYNEEADTLFSLMAAESNLLEQIISSDGEVSKEIESHMISIALSKGEVVDTFIDFMARLETKELEERTYAKQFELSARRLSDFRERLKAELKSKMSHSGSLELIGEKLKFCLAKLDDKLEIDESQLPEKFMSEKVTKVPNKELIRKGLEFEKIPGVRLIPNYSLTPRLNRRSLKGKRNEI